MGYGYGTTTRWDDSAYNVETNAKVAKVSNQVGHLWNAQSQTFARTSNGNLAFRGDSLFSYGTGWIVGKIWQGRALINSRRYSVTTSSHESEAWGATRDRIRYGLPDLPDSFARALDMLAAAQGSRDARERGKRILDCAKWADLLRATAIAPGEYGGRYGSDSVAGEPLGALVATVARLSPSAWAKADARHAADAAKAKAKQERAAQAELVANAKRAADSYVLPRAGDVADYDLKRHASRLREYRLKAGLSDKRRKRLWEAEKAVRAMLADYPRLRAIADKRGTIRRYTARLADFRAKLASAEDSETISSRDIRDSVYALRQLASLPGLIAKAAPSLTAQAAALEAIGEGPVAAAERERAEAYRLAQAERREAERIEREREIAANRAAWLAGEASHLLANFDAEGGTAAMRVYGDELQTSWGANVPLAHAVRVFRFVKLCRERGELWQRNGKQIRVGHFNVDSVAADGSFIAGCHRFAWPDIERAARQADVIDCPADDSAVESRA